jgi:cobalt-zinc-cadmium efflux system outer membrane protein
MATPPQSSGQAVAVNDLIQTAVEGNRELLAVRQRVVEARGLIRQAGMRPASSLQFGVATGKPLGSPGMEEYSAAYPQRIRDRRQAHQGSQLRGKS